MAGTLGLELGFSTITILPLKTCQNLKKIKNKSWICFSKVSFYWPKQLDFVGTTGMCPIRLVFFLVRNSECTCTGALTGTIYTSWYSMRSASLIQVGHSDIHRA